MAVWKKIRIGAALALVLLLAALVWKMDIPHWQRLDLNRLTDLASATEVFDVHGSSVGTLYGSENRRWIALSDVPAHVQSAFIAAEDLRFYQHHGVDVHRMFGALWHDLRTRSLSQGASTITQQLIKLTHLTGEKTLSRKSQEIFLALQLESRMTKAQILEAYLNVIYFGHGAYGVEAAAQTYFGKSASALTLGEGALLAGVIKSPSNYAPHLHPARALQRRDVVLTAMAENGFITDAQKQSAMAEKLCVQAEDDALDAFSWVRDAVLDEAQAALNVDAEALYNGGYRIYTGLDPDLQRAAEALFEEEERFPANAADGTPAQAALIAMAPDTGEVRALVGGRDYQVRRGFNRATQARRQPGSAFKPVSTYAAAIDSGSYVPASIVDDTPRAFAGGYTPGNAGGASYGLVTLREALSRSLNIATVDLAEAIGVDALREYAARFGLPLSPMDVNLSLALGALTEGVTAAELNAAYCALANGGTRVTAHLIQRICDAGGRELYRAPTPNVRCVGASTAYMITDMLKTAAQTGSARALASVGMPIAGKTGTVSQPGGGTRDIWTAAYTPDLAVTVWMGFDDPDGEHHLPDSAGGSGYPARLCAALFESQSERLSGRDFARPSTVKTALLDGEALKQDHVALLSTERTPRDFTLLELFHDNDLPRSFSTNWIAPSPVTDFRLLSSPGETPVLAFTAVEAAAEYALTRAAGGQTHEIAVLRGEPGEEIHFTDTSHDRAQPAQYGLIPRNALLYAQGTLLAGPMPAPLLYSPGGLLNAIMGVGTAEATPTPTEIEPVIHQSLFD